MRKNIKKLCATVVTALSMVIPGMQVHAAEPPTPTYTAEQREIFYKLWDDVLNAIDENGNLQFVTKDPEINSKITATDLVTYFRAMNLGANFGSIKYRVSERPSPICVRATLPKGLKAQNDIVRAQVKEKIAGMEPTLDTVKNLFEELASNYTYQMHGDNINLGTIDMLEMKKGNCTDFATYFKAELDAIGVENYMVTAHAKESRKHLYPTDVTGHAWNLVVIDGVCYTIDISNACLQRVEHGTSIWESFVITDDYMVGPYYDIQYIL